jgi:hypothetical protein
MKVQKSDDTRIPYFSDWNGTFYTRIHICANEIKTYNLTGDLEMYGIYPKKFILWRKIYKFSKKLKHRGAVK